MVKFSRFLDCILFFTFFFIHFLDDIKLEPPTSLLKQLNLKQQTESSYSADTTKNTSSSSHSPAPSSHLVTSPLSPHVTTSILPTALTSSPMGNAKSQQQNIENKQELNPIKSHPINSKELIDNLENLRNSDHSNSTGSVKKNKIEDERDKKPETESKTNSNETSQNNDDNNREANTEEKPRERKALKSKRKPVTMMNLGETLESTNLGLGNELHLGFFLFILVLFFYSFIVLFISFLLSLSNLN